VEGPLKRRLALDLDVAGETVSKDDVGWLSSPYVA